MELIDNLQESFVIEDSTKEIVRMPNVICQPNQIRLQNAPDTVLPISDGQLPLAQVNQIIPIDKIRSRLLQLKFLMEDHLEVDYYDPKYHFGYFLGQYIERLGVKHKEFARSISLLPTEISQIVHHHRRPKDKLAFRLDIHSGGSFPALLWFRIIQKDRLYELFLDDSYLQREKAFVECTKNILQA
ncbi:hypothetical protein GCM10027566_24180 [Arachidicoccus ginsenosidivorans]|uniref:Uncharacterized protein n=1 Tax=Arachidicoccus ginsenosidivorans TaxID=496057 RepID=A0A5B8VG16_9BACT|nr:hypothetical protein [Arachidicoccus ginsenosidivorans]QEC70410.1 hypothetical protein FSB73_00470 [Arachidicoccus ginsenosidivorans]